MKLQMISIFFIWLLCHTKVLLLRIMKESMQNISYNVSPEELVDA